MSNINASLGIAQLSKIKNFLRLKNAIHKKYKKSLDKFSNLKLLENPVHSKSNNWLNVVFIKDSNSASLKAVLKKFIKNNINIRPIWLPNHLQKPYKKFEKYKIKNANIFCKQAICLPSSSFLNEKDINNISKFFKK